MAQINNTNRNSSPSGAEGLHHPTFIIIDLFCGAGGTTTGFIQANYEGRNIAKVIACVNHDAKAIQSHWMNHTEVKHFEEDIRTLELTELIALAKYWKDIYPDAYLVLWASLECTNFSKAKGGQPRDADSRTLADHLFRYIESLDPDYVQIENVVEFMSWGPLIAKTRKTEEGYLCCDFRVINEVIEVYDEKDNLVSKTETGNLKIAVSLFPESRKNGSDWMRWRNDLCRNYNYSDEWKELNSANFGAYTSRNRLFGCFAKPWAPVCWPQPTHSKTPSKMGMYGDLQKWKPVKDVLNFKDDGQSIFTRTKPLSEKTLERIYAGLVKFIAKGDTSFISKYYSGKPNGKNITTEDPAGTVTTIDSQALVQASFLVKYNSSKNGNYNPPSLEDPSPVISTQNRIYLAQPEFIVQRNNGKPESKLVDINGPARTLTATGGNQDLIQPEFIVTSNGGIPSSKVYPVDQPSRVITTSDNQALVSPEFLASYYGNGDNVSSVESPAPTIPTKDRCALVQPEFIINYNHSSQCNDINDPAPTLLTADKLAIAKPEYFLDKHYSKSQNQSIHEPAGTIMPIDKHRLVEAEPFIMPTAYDNNPKSVDEPAPTLTASRRHHYLINPAWGGNPGSVDQPCCVVVARQDKAPLYFVQVEHGQVSIAVFEGDSLCMIRIKQFMVAFNLVDIKMRMLRVSELLRIQGFPSTYQLAGNQTDQKKFIGNSVVPHVVKSWCEAMAGKIIDQSKIKSA